MIKINGRTFERADYCKKLPSGSPHICTADGNIYPPDVYGWEEVISED